MHGQHSLAHFFHHFFVTFGPKLILLLIAGIVIFLLFLSLYHPASHSMHSAIFGSYLAEEGPPDSPMPIFVTPIH